MRVVRWRVYIRFLYRLLHQHLRLQPNFKRTRVNKIVERIVAIFFPIVLRTSHFFFFFTFCIYISSRDSSGESSASFLCFFLFFSREKIALAESNSTRGHLKKLAGVSFKKPAQLPWNVANFFSLFLPTFSVETQDGNGFLSFQINEQLLSS